MDLEDLIESFSTTPGGSTYAVTRRAVATYVEGRSTPGVTSTLSIIASVQPATGRDLLRLPEERRTNETRVVFTTTELYTGEQGGSFEADLIAIANQTWEVQHVEQWIQPGGDLVYRCVAQAAQ